MCGLTMMVV